MQKGSTILGKNCENEEDRKKIPFPNVFTLQKLLREVKRNEKWDEEWGTKISTQVFDTSVESCAQAVSDKLHKTKKRRRFFETFLKYKKKKGGKHVACFYRKDKNSFHLEGTKLSLPTFSYRHGRVTLMEPIRQEFLDAGCTIKRVYIRREAGEYYAGFQLELEKNPYRKIPKSVHSACGIDVGVRIFATIVDENVEIYEVETLKKFLARLMKQDRHYSRLLQKKQECRLRLRNKTED